MSWAYDTYMPNLVQLVSRDAPRTSHLGNLHGLTLHQLSALRRVSLVMATVSIASSVLIFVYFSRMRRKFRHDLILLLIQSDILKTLWFLIFPIVEMIQGPVESASTFCQVSGFFLTLGIEASDVAVVLIAVHTALCIFHEGSGLYPYRQWTYMVFFTFPIMMASFAFINSPAFVNSGEYCYLPIHPDWTRWALSWILRYVILVAILITYVFTYTRVTVLMKRFGAASRRESRLSYDRVPWTPRRQTASVPPTPLIARHGLIPLSPSDDQLRWSRERQFSSSAVTARSIPENEALGSSADCRGDMACLTQPVKWTIPWLGTDSPARLGDEASQIELGPLEMSSPGREGMHTIPEQAHVSNGDERLGNSNSTSPATRLTMPRQIWNRSVVATAAWASNAPSPANLLAILRLGPYTSTPSSPRVFLSPAALDGTGVPATRLEIRRQICQVFIYPVVYILVWLLPFVSHVTGGDGDRAPFGLTLASLISLCLQGAADALVFSTQEKPWRHAHLEASEKRHSFWKDHLTPDGTKTNVGRTREEMLVDLAVARRRREQEEMSEGRLEQLGPGMPTRDWWDCVLDAVDDK